MSKPKQNANLEPEERESGNRTSEEDTEVILGLTDGEGEEIATITFTTSEEEAKALFDLFNDD
ncbi:hypothetical protein BLD44_023190 [Mastigocladus laminosus UU774]|nr:hypothetical protein BLD44_023190 [Mastigocladus laminosus UU774]